MSLATRLIDLAMRVLPGDRAKWGEAMKNEAYLIEHSWESLDFAVGCLWAAIQERLMNMQTITFFGRLIVSIATALYGAFFITCAFNTAAILSGRADPFYHMLVTNHHLVAATEHLRVMPYILIFNLGMGLFNISAALFLIVWRPRIFTVACTGIAVMGGGLGMYCLTSGVSVWSPLAWAWPFIPLILLSAAAYVLWRLSLRNSMPPSPAP